MKSRKVMSFFIFGVLFISILSIGLASAGWWGDFFNKITGKAVEDEIILPGEICSPSNLADNCILLTPCSAPEWCAGYDLNQDGVATLGEQKEHDYVPAIEKSPEEITLGQEYGRTDCSFQNNWCAGADFNQNGNVDGTDLSILASATETVVGNGTERHVVNQDLLNDILEQIGVISVSSTIGLGGENCTDTDGGIQYYIKGAIIGNIPPNESGIDACLNSTTVREGYCDPDDGNEDGYKGNFYNISCYFGCEDGACFVTNQSEDNQSEDNQSEANKSCVDTDGGIQYYVFGELIGDILPGESGIDTCLNSTTLVENYCDPNDDNGDGFLGGSYTVNCFFGCYEGQGVCFHSPFQCTDTDGGIDEYTPGMINSSHFGEIYDECSYDNTTLIEYYCGNSSVLNTTFSCVCGLGACIEEVEWCSGSDFNEDGKVDGTDLAILSGQFGEINCLEPDWCDGTDTTQDGKVDGTDLARFAQQFGNTDCKGAERGFFEAIGEFFSNLFGG
jgi:hypothetical protein